MRRGSTRTGLTLDIGVGRSDLLRGVGDLCDLIAVGVNDASAGLVSSLELDLALKCLDLLLIQEVAMLIAVLDTLLAAQNLVARRGRGTRDTGLGFLGLAANRYLSWDATLRGNWRGNRLLGGLAGRDRGDGAVGIVLFFSG